MFYVMTRFLAALGLQRNVQKAEHGNTVIGEVRVCLSAFRIYTRKCSEVILGRESHWWDAWPQGPSLGGLRP